MKVPPPRLIDLGASHISLLSALHGACFEKAWGAKTFLDFFQHERVVGQLALDWRDRPLGFSLMRVTEGEGEILTLGVLEEARRKGIGRLLLSGLCDRLAMFDGNVLYLEVAETNKTAKKLYESFGFQQIGRRKDYYTNLDGSSDSALVMRRDFLL